MKLLDVLASGVIGAGSGSVDIFDRGTSTRSQLFTDYDGSGAYTPTASVPLDANGGAVIYVNRPVLCQVRDSAGNIVRQFTAFETATDVEVRSQSFTGIDYATGVSAAGNPTLLSTVLDLWKTSSGSIDFNVLLAGTTRSIQTSFGPIAGPPFFNVKDPTYGAIGNGVADDRAAIQAACTAAAAVGGWVYFPGVPVGQSYLIGAPGLTCAGVAGFIGPKGAVISCSTGATQLITVTSVSNGKFQIFGLSFSMSVPSIGWLTQSAGDLSIYDSTVSYASNLAVPSTGFVINMTGGADTTTIVNSTFTIPSTGAGSIYAIVSKTVAFLYAEFAGSFNGPTSVVFVSCTDGIIAGCDFTASDSLLGYINAAGTSQMLTVIGCDFAAPSAGILGGVFDASVQALVSEFGNSYPVGVRMYGGSIPSTDASRQYSRFASADTMEFFATDNSATVDLRVGLSNSIAFGSIRIRRTTATAQNIVMPTPYIPTQEVWITIINDSAGTPTETFTTNLVKGLTGGAVGPITAGHRVTILVKAVLVGGAMTWVIINGATGVDWV